jgi:outer membrane biosynthesis protein TonB
LKPTIHLHLVSILRISGAASPFPNGAVLIFNYNNFQVAERVEVPVYKTVQVPVEKPVPVKVEKPVPYPVEKPVPVYIEKHIPVPVPKPYPVKVPVIKYVHHYLSKHSGHH